MMAALRTALLLDRDEANVSFQAVYHRLKEPAVRSALLQVLTDRHGDDDLFPQRGPTSSTIFCGLIPKLIGRFTAG